MSEYTVRLDPDNDRLGRYVVSRGALGWSWVWLEWDTDVKGWFKESHRGTYPSPWGALRSVADDADASMGGGDAGKVSRKARALATRLENAASKGEK